MSTLENDRGLSRRGRRRRHPRSARVLAALSAIALVAAAPSAAHATGWVESPSFDAPSNDVGGDFVEAADGSSTASWLAADFPDDAAPVTTVQVQHAAPDGAVSPPITIGSGAYPTLATANGRTALAWVDISDDDAYKVMLTLFDASGARVRDVTVATLSDGDQTSLADVALDDAGNATLVWGDSATKVMAARVPFNGAPTAPVALGDDVALGGAPALGGFAPTVVVTPGGTAWVGWLTSGGKVEVARLDGNGGIDGSVTQLSADGDDAYWFAMSASAAGGAIAWISPDGADATTAHINGVRLNATGPLSGTGFGATGAANAADGEGSALASTGIDVEIGPDNVVSLAWTKATAANLTQATLSRFAPGQTTAPAKQLGDSSAQASVAPTLGAAPDGSIMAAWLDESSMIGVPIGLTVEGARIAPDGTIGAPSALQQSGLNGETLYLPFSIAQADNGGSGIVGIQTVPVPLGGGGGPLPNVTFRAFRLDAVGPTVTLDVPPTGAPLTPIIFSGTVADPSTAVLSWDFGDGASARGLRVSHVYAGPGTYTVTASATDDAGNTTTVTREITIAVPPTGGGRNPPPPAAAVAARLRIARAVRRGAKVTVSGTINRSARGTVAVVYAQKVGRRTVRAKKRARIAKGKWSATLTLPRALTRGRAARGKGTVKVTFAGTAAVKRASATHRVTIARARRARRAKRAKHHKQSKRSAASHTRRR